MSKRRRKSLASFLEDIIDDSKDFIDDLADRMRSVEDHAHDVVRDVASDEPPGNHNQASDGDDAELAELRESLADLTEKVNKLARTCSGRGGAFLD
jgi:DNA-binding ferritin-like protein